MLKKNAYFNLFWSSWGRGGSHSLRSCLSAPYRLLNKLKNIYDSRYGGHASRDHTAADSFNSQLSLLKTRWQGWWDRWINYFVMSLWLRSLAPNGGRTCDMNCIVILTTLCSCVFLAVSKVTGVISKTSSNRLLFLMELFFFRQKLNFYGNRN